MGKKRRKLRKDTIKPLSIGLKRCSKSEGLKYPTCLTTSVKQWRKILRNYLTNKLEKAKKKLNSSGAKEKLIKVLT